MDISGFSSPQAGTTEYTPRQRANADALPTLSQLRQLLEEAQQEEIAPAPEQEPPEADAAPAAEPEAFVPSVDIPSLEQLRALRLSEEREPDRTPQPAADQPAPEEKRASSPIVRRSTPSPRQKRPANAVRVVSKPKAAPAAQEPVTQSAPSLQTAVDLPTLDNLKRFREELEAEERETAAREAAAREAAAREAAAKEAAAREAAAKEAAAREAAAREAEAREAAAREAEAREAAAREAEAREAAAKEAAASEAAAIREAVNRAMAAREKAIREAAARKTVQEPAEVSTPADDRASDRLASDLPSLAQLRALRNEAFREPSEADTPAVPEQRRPAPEAPAVQQTRPQRPSRLDAIPSLEQLKTLLAEEESFGNVSFQENVRQVKKTISDIPPVPADEQRMPETEPQNSVSSQYTSGVISATQAYAAAAQRRAAEAKPVPPEKVHYIPYEEFVPGKEFEDVSEFYGRKAKAAASAREAARKLFADDDQHKGEPIYFKEFGKKNQSSVEPEEKTPALKRKEKRERKKKQKKNEDFSGSVLEELPSTQQLNKSKPKYGRSTDVKAKKKPSNKQLVMERRRLRYKHDFYRVLRSTVFTLITVSAIAVLIAVLLLPVLRIYGTSMTPTLNESDIVLSVKGGKFDTGDVIAFYYNNKILVKRVIAQAGDWVDITKDGTVIINGEVLTEPYVKNKAFGECDIELPYQVPEDRVFVMGDYRDVSIDSRNTTIGPIAEEQIVGKIIYRIWPMNEMGEVS